MKRMSKEKSAEKGTNLVVKTVLHITQTSETDIGSFSLFCCSHHLGARL